MEVITDNEYISCPAWFNDLPLLLRVQLIYRPSIAYTVFEKVFMHYYKVFLLKLQSVCMITGRVVEAQYFSKLDVDMAVCYHV